MSPEKRGDQPAEEPDPERVCPLGRTCLAETCPGPQRGEATDGFATMGGKPIGAGVQSVEWCGMEPTPLGVQALRDVGLSAEGGGRARSILRAVDGWDILHKRRLRWRSFVV